MSYYVIIDSPKFSQVSATFEKRETDLGGTSPRVVKLIPRRAGSISSCYGANLLIAWNKKKTPSETWKKNRIKNDQ